MPNDTAQSPLIYGIKTAAPHSAGSAPPSIPMPDGAVDCHHHIFDSRYQKYGEIYVPSATVADYRLFKQRLGISRSVIVAPSNYNDDNSCLLDALDQLGPAQARGIAHVYPDISDTELNRFQQHGVRGLRVYLAKNRVPSRLELLALGQRAAERGWTIQLVGDRKVEVFVEWEETLTQMACNIVVDHFGWTPQPAGSQSATAATLRRLLDNERAYIKLSGLYLSSAVGHPGYADVSELAIQLIETAPDQVIWGTDWPHPMAMASTKIPDGAMLADRLAEWAPDEAIRKKILVDNPDKLYWFD